MMDGKQKQKGENMEKTDLDADNGINTPGKKVARIGEKGILEGVT